MQALPIKLLILFPLWLIPTADAFGNEKPNFIVILADDLYQFNEDPGERNNLAAKHPDKVRELRTALEACETLLSDTTRKAGFAGVQAKEAAEKAVRKVIGKTEPAPCAAPLPDSGEVELGEGKVAEEQSNLAKDMPKRPPGTDHKVEIQRTKPDIVLYDPAGGEAPPWSDPDFFWLNEHILVQPNGKGELLAMWTSERLKPWKWRVMYSHSKDGGETWTKAAVLDSPRAAWQVPVICPKTGRIYVFMTHGFLYGGLRCYTSDDGGHTWSDPVELEFAKGPTDHPSKKASWISPTVPHWDGKGRPLIAFTRWATGPGYPGGVAGSTQIEYVRIENLDESPEPRNLRFSWLNLDDPITVPHRTKKGFSYAQEPYTVTLPDGRLFVVMRTDSGRMWYSVSDDEGESWRQSEPLLYRDGGEPILHPVSPGPIFRLERGDYLLLYNNNDGTGKGLKGPEDRAARRPAYLARGEFRPDAHQPVWFSRPKLFIDNDKVPWGPPGRERLEAATYTSLTEINGKRILWYPDRKMFLLGKLIPDSLLDAMEVPD